MVIRNFSKQEKIDLTAAFIYVGNDEVVGAHQASSMFWRRIYSVVPQNFGNNSVNQNQTTSYSEQPSSKPVCFIPYDLIDESLDEWRYSLIGRLDLVKLKFDSVVEILKKQRKLKGTIQCIPLGKGFFIIKLDNDEDKHYIWEGYWPVEDQTLRIRAWEPNFNPANQKSTTTFVWVQFPGLSIKYWKESILIHIGRSIGKPVRVDETTLKREAGYYARVLVEIDLTKFITSKVQVDTKYGIFEQVVQFTNLPKFCNHCSVIGHYVAECRSKRKEQEQQQEIPTAPKEVTKVWRRVTNKQKNKGFDVCFTDKELDVIPSTSQQDNNVEEDCVMEEDSVIEKIIPSLGHAECSIQQVVVSSPSINASVNVLPPSGKIGTISAGTAPAKQKINNVGKVTTRRQAATINSNGSKFVFVAEPKIRVTTDFCKKLNLPNMHYKLIHNSTENKKGNIWMFWNVNITTPTVVSNSAQAITVDVGGVLVTGVHAACLTVDRRELWEELEFISSLGKPWMVIGYFNTIMCAEEKKRGRSPLTISMNEFNSCLHSCGLIQAPKYGIEFSWCNNRFGICILDRAVFNVKWLECYPGWCYKVGARGTSDHSALLGVNSVIPKPANVPFMALKVWLSHPGFLKLIKDSWVEEISGNHAFSFLSKLKILKQIIKVWKWEIFGDVRTQLQNAEKEVVQDAKISDNQPDDIVLLDKLITARGKQELLLQQNKEIAQQKARVQWLKDGASNSSFFHNSIKLRQLHNAITELENSDDTIVSTQQEISNTLVDYFENKFKMQEVTFAKDIFHTFPKS
ncbi:uncharacterized protein LOC113360422 [Papaver somniferum]|uniref:uncharacterized protein LOC113360422 n=1 Tax=Papaver somniferum TaxID=3469 RepID=UPI000E6F63E8|nr:uncharacterized protein LOC113360422 [Papaver somniferum]